MRHELLLPPEPNRTDGAPRRVGVEIEFTGIDAHDAARLVRHVHGGEIEVVDEHRYKVRGTSLGDFTVELDWFAAHAGDRQHPRGKLRELEDKLRAAVGEVGSLVMPFEVSCPPVPIERLGELDALVGALRRQGAQGTEGRFFYAFGLHFNPELPRHDATLIVATVKAYLLLSEWLRADTGVAMARRIAPFVHRFTEDYTALTVDPAYMPDMAGFARDYVRHNPNRNRELDLYPLIACLAPVVLAGTPSDPNVKPRPTWHWRLPDSRVGETGWSVVPDWNRWVQVERLATDPWALRELGDLWLDCRAAGALADWPRRVDRWLAP